MASRVKNISIDQGADFSIVFSAYESPSATAVMDLETTHYANAQMRKSDQHTDSAFTFTTSVAAGSDLITISANNLQTSSVKAGRYLYEVILTDSSVNPDTKIRVLEGVASVTSSVEVGAMYTINSTGYDVRSSYT
jgi:hypothetical protein